VGFNPHKRIDLILRAHATIVNRMIAADEAVPYLVLVGTRTNDVFYSEARLLDALIAELGTAEWVKWAGWVADSELRHLHSGAVALLLPSEAEGFGLPAVEAAACDTPIIATMESPLPQLLAGGGLWVSPGDEQALEEAMSDLLDDEPKRMALGRVAGERARALSWARSAAITMDVLREAAA
jgi:glycosyltransferase involved in cell wall biosynthesis